MTNHLHIIFFFQFVVISTIKTTFFPSCKTGTSAVASAYEPPSSFDTNDSDDGQHEEEGAQVDNLWLEINTDDILGFGEPQASTIKLAPYLQEIIIAAGNIGKTTAIRFFPITLGLCGDSYIRCFKRTRLISKM